MYNCLCISKRDLQITPESEETLKTKKGRSLLYHVVRYIDILKTVYFSINFVQYGVADNRCWLIIDNLRYSDLSFAAEANANAILYIFHFQTLHFGLSFVAEANRNAIPHFLNLSSALA